ncbi:MAG: methyltransferase [Aulosira sp. ZfuVER01]|nr:class I SAM-dependent methyltransferase [Aulosira sp. ZfuVER01]MDZ8002890.1 class I SAM-dependent methyltransferase [Aulosira sp. DedVER01a]MDZ8053599.1 class I SAM-dependent methyltransferase [Aulosira sp. ZfuCHP01]
MSDQPSPPSPAHFFNTVNSYQQTAAIKAAVELEVFTAIGSGIESAASLAQKCQASERGMRMLCDYLTIIGFLIKETAGYKLTPDSAKFLDKKSPAYAGDVMEFLLSDTITQAFANLTNAVRQGGTALSSKGTLESEHPVWVRFARAMSSMMRMPAKLIAQLVNGDNQNQIKVLDIAASHGLFGIAFAQQNPNAEIVALDWQPVLEVAKENAINAGVGERFRTIPGSAFDVDYGRDYDIILLPNFLHHFDIPTCEQLLRKIHAALTENGRVMTFEFIPDSDRINPPDAAAFSLTMLATTPQGDAYTFAEYEQMFANAGFGRSELHSIPPLFQRIVISYK